MYPPLEVVSVGACGPSLPTTSSALLREGRLRKGAAAAEAADDRVEQEINFEDSAEMLEVPAAEHNGDGTAEGGTTATTAGAAATAPGTDAAAAAAATTAGRPLADSTAAVHHNNCDRGNPSPPPLPPAQQMSGGGGEGNVI